MIEIILSIIAIALVFEITITLKWINNKEMIKEIVIEVLNEIDDEENTEVL